jgi:hypothetical protein
MVILGKCTLHIRFLLLVLLTGFLSVVTAACFGRTTPPGPDMAGGVYEFATYEYSHWQEGLNILIWHDANASSTCNSSGSTSSDTHLVQCQAVSEDGFELFWQIETSDGRSAQFTINNQAFDLADGTVFLITTDDDQLDIQQLQRDLSGVNAEHQSITDFSLDDPEINQFIQSTVPEE